MMMRKTNFLFISCVLILQAGCGGNPVRTVANNDFLSESRVWSTPENARKAAFDQARERCNSRSGQGVDISGQGTAHDNIGLVYRVRFQCYDLAQRAKEEKARAEAIAEEARRMAAKRAEEERLAEIERRRREVEWERTRPQREAQERKERLAQEADARRRQDAERKRLALVCPMYYFARQTCASAGNYDSCMNIRLSNKFSSWDDRTCFNR